MSLSQYTDYTAARTNLNGQTSNVGSVLLSKSTDPIAVCVTDFTQKNVWFIEVISSTVNNNAVTIKGPGIRLVFDNPFFDANHWVNLLSVWDGKTSEDLVQKMDAATRVGFMSLSKCEICGIFKKNTGSNPTNVFTLNSVLKNNTIKTNDDNIIVAMTPAQAAKVGTLVTFLTTKNEVVSQIANGISFLNGSTTDGILGTTVLSYIN